MEESDYIPIEDLLAAAEELNVSKRPVLVETDIFATENDTQEGQASNANEKKSNLLHTGDTDSSDDEDKRNFEDSRYTEYGRNIKQILKSTTKENSTFGHESKTTSWKKPSKSKQLEVPTSTIQTCEKSSDTKKFDVYCDPIFGLRIVNPVFPITTLQERMQGKIILPFSRIKNFSPDKDSDYVIGAVLINKSPVKTSQSGNQFIIWYLSDLKNDIKTISLFLFGKAYKQLWKTASGCVVAVLNPSLLEKKEGSKDEAAFSVMEPQRVMILGQSKDLGTCRSKKKNGEPCTAIVNLTNCEYCVYHIKQEYQKCSIRSELQSSFGGGGLTSLRNKVLGKHEVFYAGKSYTSIPAKKNKKQTDKDNNRMKLLSGMGVCTNSNDAVKPKTVERKQNASRLDVPLAQRKKDLETLKKLGIDKDLYLNKSTSLTAEKSSDVTLEESKSYALDVIKKRTEHKSDQKNININVKVNSKPSVSSNDLTMDIPFLENGANSIIDLNAPITAKHTSRAKLNAIKYIQRNGPIKKSDPNMVKSTGKKRPLDNSNKIEPDSKVQKVLDNEFYSDRFKKMMAISSKNTDLLEQKDNEEMDKYFNKLEAREKMEEKMANTFKVACKAVRCLKCKYTNFSASDLCKQERHPLKVFDATKRFFKCGHCGNRTCCLEIFPTKPCSNCGSGKWERTGMMKEKVVGNTHALSIRGGENKFINSVSTNANLDLLVPDN